MRSHTLTHFILWPVTFFAWAGLFAAIPVVFATISRMMAAFESVAGASGEPFIPVIQVLAVIPLYAAVVFTPVILYGTGGIRAPALRRDLHAPSGFQAPSLSVCDRPLRRLPGSRSQHQRSASRRHWRLFPAMRLAWAAARD